MPADIPRVALVYAPFAQAESPAFGLSLLKSGLNKEGISAEILYLNILLARDTGFDLYGIIQGMIPGQALLGEWLFSSALFGDNPDTDRAYLSRILWGSYQEIFSAEIVHALITLRNRLPGFLDEWIEATDWTSYSWVGFSSSYQQQCASLALARRIKSRYPDIRILFGGFNCFGEMGAALLRTFPFVDYVCPGEGDIAVPALIKAGMQGETLTPIPGILSRTGTDDSAMEKMSVVTDMDFVPSPDYSDFFAWNSKAGTPFGSYPELYMEMSRGCWYGEQHPCRFCGMEPGLMKYREKTPARILDEFRSIVEHSNRILFTDSVLSMDLFRNVIPAMAAIPGSSLFAEVRPQLTEKQVSLLAQAGFTRVQTGIESFSDHILHLIGKGSTLDQNIAILKWGKKHGVSIIYNLLWGFPGEDPEEYRKMEELIPLLVHLDPPVRSAGHVRFDRSSEYMRNPERYGLSDIRPVEAYSYVYPTLNRDDLMNLAYYFSASYSDNSDRYTQEFSRIIVEWHNNPGAVLDLFENEGSIRIVDTRIPNQQKEYHFEGMAASLYLACDISKTLEEMEAEYGPCNADISTIVQLFIRKGLMVQSGNRYISLAVQRT